MAKVVVGMSGGVDSAVTAYLLKEAGYEVIGLTLRTWQSEDGKESRCCEIDDARRVAWKLSIPYYTLNCIPEFEEQVTKPFMHCYLEGKTPNPCIECNRYVKWDRMLHFAKSMGAEYIATGHYAHVIQLENGRYTVKMADFAKKDQTYMLYKLTQEQLKSTLMPLGKMNKDDVREIARTQEIPVASKPDSQEICFVTEGHYAEFIEKHSDETIPGKGKFVNEEGQELGEHQGVIHYTVGQRKGLGISFSHPLYVKEIQADTNEIVLGDNDSLFHKDILCSDVNYMGISDLAPGESLECFAKIRYHHDAQKATIQALEDGKVKLSFEEPVRAATPGQSAVFYDENRCVLGGGIIHQVL